MKFISSSIGISDIHELLQHALITYNFYHGYMSKQTEWQGILLIFFVDFRLIIIIIIIIIIILV